MNQSHSSIKLMKYFTLLIAILFSINALCQGLKTQGKLIVKRGSVPESRSIDLKELNRGIYILQLLNASEGETTNRRILIVK